MRSFFGISQSVAYSVMQFGKRLYKACMKMKRHMLA